MIQNYYTYVANIDNERYLLVFETTIYGLTGKDFRNISILADNLSINKNNIVYDYFYRNGHINYVYNRLFAVNKETNILSNLNNEDVSFKILKECNKWWSNNIDLLYNYIHNKNIERLHYLDNINYNYCWFDYAKIY